MLAIALIACSSMSGRRANPKQTPSSSRQKIKEVLEKVAASRRRYALAAAAPAIRRSIELTIFVMAYSRDFGGVKVKTALNGQIQEQFGPSLYNALHNAPEQLFEPQSTDHYTTFPLCILHCLASCVELSNGILDPGIEKFICETLGTEYWMYDVEYSSQECIMTVYNVDVEDPDADDISDTAIPLSTLSHCWGYVYQMARNGDGAAAETGGGWIRFTTDTGAINTVIGDCVSRVHELQVEEKSQVEAMLSDGTILHDPACYVSIEVMGRYSGGPVQCGHKIAVSHSTSYRTPLLGVLTMGEARINPSVRSGMKGMRLMMGPDSR